MRLTIDISEEEALILRKRGRKSYLKLKEQVEDIIRRSCINSKNNPTSRIKVDDSLVEIFSREKRGKS
jgi:hypothetical protein